jgi:hypothetical protein
MSINHMIKYIEPKEKETNKTNLAWGHKT